MGNVVGKSIGALEKINRTFLVATEVPKGYVIEWANRGPYRDMPAYHICIVHTVRY